LAHFDMRRNAAKILGVFATATTEAH